MLKMRSYMFTTIGFTNSLSDNFLFIYNHGFHMDYMLLYVDDIILIPSSAILHLSLIVKLSYKFALKDLGTLNYFLGFVITHYLRDLFFSQKKYAIEILDRASMSSCKHVPTSVVTTTFLRHTVTTRLTVD